MAVSCFFCRCPLEPFLDRRLLSRSPALSALSLASLRLLSCSIFVLPTMFELASGHYLHYHCFVTRGVVIRLILLLHSLGWLCVFARLARLTNPISSSSSLIRCSLASVLYLSNFFVVCAMRLLVLFLTLSFACSLPVLLVHLNQYL